MTTLAEIEDAARALPREQQRSLFEWLAHHLRMRPAEAGARQSVLEITPVSAGKIIRPSESDDDILGEMLEDRR